MNEQLTSIDWTNCMSTISIDDSCEYFSSTLTDIMNSCIPLYKPRLHKSIYTNREAIRLKNRKNKL